MAAILFAIAVLARNEVVPFIGALILLIGYIIGDALLQDIRHEQLAALADPFGIRTLALVTKYWTVATRTPSPPVFPGSCCGTACSGLALLWPFSSLAICVSALPKGAAKPSQ